MKTVVVTILVREPDAGKPPVRFDERGAEPGASRAASRLYRVREFLWLLECLSCYPTATCTLQQDPAVIMQPAEQLSLAFFDSVPVVVESWAARISSDAGLLPFCQLDEHLGLTRQFAARGDAHPAHTNPKRERAQN